MKCDDAPDSDGRLIGDADYFAVIRGAMKVLNFTDEEQWNIWRIVALVMHLGNLVFVGEAGGRDRCGELSRSIFSRSTILLHCSNIVEV